MGSPQCPKCNNVLAEDYGMVTCGKCGTIVFIDMDGIAHLGQESEPSTSSETAPDLLHAVTKTGITPQQIEDANVAPESFADQEIELNDFSPAEINVEETPVNGLTPNEDFAPIDMEPVATEAVEVGVAAFETPSIEAPPEDELNMDQFLGFQEPPQTAEDASTDDQVGAPGDPLGLSGYANSEMSSAKDGLLLFNILISGIDTKEMRESLREAMEDSRFGWNIERLMASIRKGVLTIDNVSAVKASIFINRIKRLPVQIRWEQNAITQMPGSEFGGEFGDGTTEQ